MGVGERERERERERGEGESKEGHSLINVERYNKLI